MIRWSLLVPAFLGLALWAPPGPAWAGQIEDEVPEAAADEVAKAQKSLQAHLEKIRASGGQILHLKSPALSQNFPGSVFFALRFRIFPVARVLPEGLNPSNLFVVGKEGKVQHIRNARELERFFRVRLVAVQKHAQAENALASWLSLAQEFSQDGFFRFEILNEGFAVAEKGRGNWYAAGRALVVQGGNGELNVTLLFEDSKLAKVTQSSVIRPGPRPICQASKLLDPDSIVRRMAEQDLRCMGLAAREYLMEQRVQANPQLRRAIDRLWRAIVKEGW